VKEIVCARCGIRLGEIEKARIIKGITFLCPLHSVDAESMRKAAAAFAGNKSKRPDKYEDFLNGFGKMMGL
jgi:hypothetical protein